MLMALLFFVLGFVTWLNGPLISFVRVAFTLDDVSAFLIPMVFYLSYFLFALPASHLARYGGLKHAIELALVIMAAGALMVGNFISMRWYGGVLSGLLVTGGGLALLQVSVNPYVTYLGTPERAAQRIAIMGVCNKCAGILAPLVLALWAMRDIGTVVAHAATGDDTARQHVLVAFAHAIYWPYMGMAGGLLCAAAGVFLSSLPDIRPGEEGRAQAGLHRLPARVLPGVVVMFLYVGVEVLAGDAVGTYGQGFGLPIDQTRFFTAFTLLAMLVGYVMGVVFVPRYISQERYMMFSCLAGTGLSVCAFLTHGYMSVVFVALLGAANAMVMPALFPLAIRGCGARTTLASALLVMAFCGGGVLPLLFAWLKSFMNFQLVFCCLAVPSYVSILLYIKKFGSHGTVEKIS